jgi:adenine-specific DNA-methyltransferase
LLEEKINYATLQNADELITSVESIKSEEEKNFEKFDIKIENNTLQLYGIRDVTDLKPGLGGNLKYFVTDFVDAERTDMNKKNLAEYSTKMLCLKEDCFDEVKSEKFYQIFTNPHEKYLGIVYNYRGIESIKKDIRNIGKPITVYIFSLDESAREEEFDDIKELVTLRPIPAIILNVYDKIFK